MLLALGAPIVLVLTLFNVGGTFLIPFLGWQDFAEGMLFVELLLRMLCIIAFAVAWHRFYLDPRDSTVLRQLMWDRDKTRFLLYTLLLGAMAGVPVGLVLGVFNNSAAILPVLLAMMYVHARLSLLFPIIACGGRFKLAEAWRMTEEHQVLMALVYAFSILLYLVTAAGTAILAGIVYTFAGVDSVSVTFVVTLFQSAVNLWATAWVTSLLSCAYKVVRQHEYRVS